MNTNGPWFAWKLYSLSLRNIFLFFQLYPQTFQRGQEPTVRQEDLFEGRLPPGSLTSLVSSIALEITSLLFLLVTLSRLMKKGSFHLKPAPYTQASPEPWGNLRTNLFFNEKDKMFLDPQGRSECRQESCGGLIWNNNCPRDGTRAHSYSRARGMGWEQITWQLGARRAAYQAWFRRVTDFPGRHQATRAQVGLPF